MRHRSPVLPLCLLVFAGGLVPEAAHAATAAEAIAALNAQRTANGIPGDLSENTDWSRGCQLHETQYVPANGRFGASDRLGMPDPHDEDPTRSGYTPEGQSAAQHGVLGGTWSGSANPYEFAPGHLAQTLAPRLSSVGYYDGCMNTLSGVDRPLPSTPATYSYPGNNTEIYYAETAAEWPGTPGQQVGIPKGTRTGPYILLFAFGRHTPFAWTIPSPVLTGPDGPVETRVFDFETPRGVAYVIPVEPLRPGSRYHLDAAAASNPIAASSYDMPLSWSIDFTTRPASPFQPRISVEPGSPNAASWVTLSGAAQTDDPITDWTWSFGDRATGSGPSIQHVWRKPGRYAVTLTTTTTSGATASATRTVRVAANQACRRGPNGHRRCKDKPSPAVTTRPAPDLGEVGSIDISNGTIQGTPLGITSPADITSQLGESDSASGGLDSLGRVTFAWPKTMLTGATFGKDQYATAGLVRIYTTNPRARTYEHIGPGATLAAVRKAFPKARCAADGAAYGCSLAITSGKRPARAVFKFPSAGTTASVAEVAMEYTDMPQPSGITKLTPIG